MLLLRFLLLVDDTFSRQLNVLHWRLADTQSFPLEMASEQTYLLPQFGAYDASKIYTQEVIRALVRHANIRGMHIVLLAKSSSHHIV